MTHETRPQPLPIWKLHETPHWDALRAVIGTGNLCLFMPMGEATQGTTIIYPFKHAQTGRYLNIDATGQTYQYHDGHYRPIPLSEALADLIG